jgi:chitinase
VNDILNGPYAYHRNQWVGYDTVESAKVKAEYVNEKGLGGAMIWELSTDDFIVSSFICHNTN